MFKTIVAALLCLSAAAFFGTTEAAGDGFVIHGVAQGAADGVEVQLAPTSGEQIDAAAPRKPVATTTVKDGKFTLTGKVDYPSPHSIFFLVAPVPTDNKRVPYQPEVTVFLENAPVDVSVVMTDLPKDLPAAFAGKPGHLRAQVKGSASHETYLEYMAGLQPIDDARTPVFREYSGYLRNQKTKPVAEGTAIVTRLDEVAARKKAYIEEFIRDHRDDFVALHVAKLNLGTLKLQEIETMLAGFSPRLRGSAAWPVVRAEADRIKQSAVGAKFVDLALNDHEGNPVKLSDHVGKGKYVLLEFWASWCGPCRADIPHLKEAYALYNPAGFQVISISMDSDKDAWLKAVADEKMPWLQASDMKAFQGDISKIYNFRGIPACVLIGPDGTVVDRNARGSWLDRKLIELYGDKFPDKAAAAATASR